MASAFGEAEFRILWDGNTASMPGWEQENYTSTMHVPGGNVNETFLLGRGPLTRTFTVLCETQSHYVNLRAMLQTTATLRVPAAMNDLDDADVTEVVYFGTVYAELANVTLLTLTAPQKWVDGAVSVSATFQKDEPA